MYHLKNIRDDFEVVSSRMLLIYDSDVACGANTFGHHLTLLSLLPLVHIVLSYIFFEL